MQILLWDKDKIGEDRWNQLIETSQKPLLYAHWEYLNAISNDWKVLADQEFKFVMPIFLKRKFGIRISYNPFFIQKLGIFSSQNIGNEIVLAFIKCLKNIAKRIDIHWNDSCVSIKEIVPSLKIRNNYFLELNAPYSVLYNQFSSHTKRKLKQSEKQKLEVSTYDEIIDAFQEYMPNEAKMISTENWNRFKKALSHFNGLALKSYNQSGDLLAGAVLIKQWGRIYYLNGFTSKASKEPALYYLFNHIIETHCNQNLILDFEGSDIAGIARFYEGFGAKKEEYYSTRFYSLF